ncbi:hypothetical protein BpHYR1_008741 [Brachionus plicatilis]|uniref:Uncharacterized protein n=1 Tax=Brachionus plicatilis TaxID=10195 RepID=A0A3M7RV71_BRAPC|nr:hypothetical protein BpHYR1_008741 [Brachionus plicatilis]
MYSLDSIEEKNIRNMCLRKQNDRVLTVQIELEGKALIFCRDKLSRTGLFLFKRLNDYLYKIKRG